MDIGFLKSSMWDFKTMACANVQIPIGFGYVGKRLVIHLSMLRGGIKNKVCKDIDLGAKVF